MSWDIVGAGVRSNIGAGLGDSFAALCAGRTALAGLRAFDLDRFHTHHAYEVDDRKEPGVDEPLRATRWLVHAIGAALADAGLGDQPLTAPVLVGTTLRELRTAELWWYGEADLSPDDLHFGPALRRAFGARETYTVANACAASLYALGMGADLIELGLTDRVVVAGVDAITESAFGLLDRVHAEPPAALLPFHRARRGMLMGEGAVAVVLQRAGLPAAKRYGRVRSVALNCDARHPTAPDRANIAGVMREAHTRAAVEAGDIDLVMLHGSGTPLNDEAEAGAVREVFDPPRANPAMTAIKSVTGHTAGGSGLLSMLMATESMRRGVVPPVLGLTDPTPAAAGFRLVRDRPWHGPVRVAQVNAFGFGGVNAVSVIEAVAS
ncbi:beta-ketoacyl synthase N-terminal-like domain-containing protein [Micromonospora sp. NPDC048905]|uniref:beta-ketoacyl synthase N-terminal-like domain-containing protein n=1 Tax=unclassified Micromonospora TaxID=2617518 RepID=UPI003405552F